MDTNSFGVRQIMHKQFLVTVFLLLTVAFPAAAQEGPRALVLPFEVYSRGDLAALKQQIRQLVSQELAGRGISIAETAKVSEKDLSGLSTQDLRNLGRRAAADFVIFGSFTQIGQGYSVDAGVLNTYGDDPQQLFYVESQGTENIADSIRQLAKDISMRMLKLERVSQVLISGNDRIETDAIKRGIETAKDTVFLNEQIQEDIKAVYAMGYFDDVRVTATDTPEGRQVTFQVEEKETIRHIGVRGNRRFDDEEIKGLLGTRTGAIANVAALQRDVREIEDFYKQEGYHNVQVGYEIDALAENRANIDFIVEEGEKAFIRRISFAGNTAYEDDTLKDLMKTSEKGFFSWLTSSGDLDRQRLEQDTAKIAAFYHNHGYIQARVATPVITYEADSIFIDIKIEEGPQFNIGAVDIEGDLILPKEDLLATLKIKNEQVYNREVVREDILSLADTYSDSGYAYADISPRIDKDMEIHQADVTYVVDKGPLVYFERIVITGNTKTRDKVIRRQLKIYEQELFSGKRLKRGTRNLYRLDYFEDVKVNTTQGSADDKMVVNIDVTEKPTGAFSFGGGYSSVDQLFAMASISQRNLFGRGQTLNLRGQVGDRTSTYTFSFTEPWLFDIPLSAGIDLYNTSTDYDTYDKDSFGGSLRFSYPFWDYTRVYLSYNYDDADIENLTAEASSAIREFEGGNVTHTLSTSLRRDTRDRIFNPTEGSSNAIYIEHAGTPFGGDVGFTKYTADSKWYIPLFWDTVGAARGRIGFIHGDTVGAVPTWERFYLGGMDSVRGYDWRDISPRDPKTNDEIGGNKMMQFNLEFLFPLVKKSGLRGVLFADAGNAYDNGEELSFGDLRRSIGYGFRWYSPIGPIRLEYGYIIDDKEGRKGEGGWEFSMGMAF